jgi:SAM-dependent methyltransferase
VAADVEQLPFPPNTFQRVECDAVLEHVRKPERAMGEIRRVLAPGGYLHLVTPFCHPFHAYPRDFRRFTIRQTAAPILGMPGGLPFPVRLDSLSTPALFTSFEPAAFRQNRLDDIPLLKPNLNRVDGHLHAARKRGGVH